MSAFDPIDNWFEKGFRIRTQRASSTRRNAIRSRAGGGLSSTSGVKLSSSARQRNTVSVIRRAPEVMVKITGKSTGLASVKRHLDYISRNGNIELTDENGCEYKGRAEVSAIRENYKAAQIPEESKKREFLHVIFSMPPGTPEKEMRDAVMRFCQEEFSNRRYVAAYHDDTDHAHMHVCINTRDIDRCDEPRLSPKKADLFRWRQGFAEKLRENGIDAAASERRHRFNYRKPEKSAIRQIRADNPESAVYNSRRASTRAADKALRAALSPKTSIYGPPKPPRVPQVIEKQKEALLEALRSGRRPINPHEDAIKDSQAIALAGWKQVENNLRTEGKNSLADDVSKLVAKGESPTRSQAQELFDTAQQRSRGAADEAEI